MAPQQRAISIPASSRTRFSGMVSDSLRGRNSWQTRRDTMRTAVVPMIKVSPPIVGVPCLFLCQEGPSSRIVWPKWRRCRAGIIFFPSQ